MIDQDGSTLSIGHDWRASMMSLSAKDPYWQAAVRREIADHPEYQAEIEDLCSVCHMPMFRTLAVANGRKGEILRYLDGGFTADELTLATDGVSCTVCHQIKADNLGAHESFDGGYVIDTSPQASVFGPYEIDTGRTHLMQSAANLAPVQSTHIQSAQMCATCHTLSTPTRNADGAIVGHFAEQAPYLEWRESQFAGTQTCQDCHMPEVEGTAQIASVLGEARQNVSRHTFRGGNAFMLGLLNRYRDDLGVTTPAAELERAQRLAIDHLQNHTADIAIENLRHEDGHVELDVTVTAHTGHKLPTAYPSRRAWLHVTVAGDGRTLFESGRLGNDGSIVGNDNDAHADAFEPHYQTISSPEQVQIYEVVIYDRDDRITTSLVAADHYAKDNRLLPLGFDKTHANEDVQVFGRAKTDEDFVAGRDRVRYVVEIPASAANVTVTAELVYQPIGFRWAANLAPYSASEAQRFVRYYRDNAEDSATVIARATEAISR
jgi:hypothetical protein